MRTDGRALSHAALEAIRLRAVERVETGESPEVVIRAVGLSRPRIYEWIARYRTGGREALKARPVPGRPPTLKGPQVQWLYRAVVEKDPRQFGFAPALWTVELIRELIRRQFGALLSDVSVSRLLRRLGLSPQTPLWRASRHAGEGVDRWLAEGYRQVRAEARRAGAQIYFVDEEPAPWAFLPGTKEVHGPAPVVRSTAARGELSVISAVSPRRHWRFMLAPGAVTAGKFAGFLHRLLHEARRPVYLIADGRPTCRAASVRRIHRATAGRLRLFCLSRGCPDVKSDALVSHHGVSSPIRLS